MLKHIVMYKLKEDSEIARRQLRDKFLSMRGLIPALKGIDAGVDETRIARSYDVVLVCDFDNRAGLDEYLIHPEHIKVRDYVHSVVEKSHSVDYEY